MISNTISLFNMLSNARPSVYAVMITWTIRILFRMHTSYVTVYARIWLTVLRERAAALPNMQTYTTHQTLANFKELEWHKTRRFFLSLLRLKLQWSLRHRKALWLLMWSRIAGYWSSKYIRKLVSFLTSISSLTKYHLVFLKLFFENFGCEDLNGEFWWKSIKYVEEYRTTDYVVSRTVVFCACIESSFELSNSVLYAKTYMIRHRLVFAKGYILPGSYLSLHEAANTYCCAEPIEMIAPRYLGWIQDT